MADRLRPPTAFTASSPSANGLNVWPKFRHLPQLYDFMLEFDPECLTKLAAVGEDFLSFAS
jgi:hypothetical protein